MIVGRVQVNGEADLSAVHAVQDQFTLTPLSVREHGATPATPGAPKPDARAPDGLQWWEQSRAYATRAAAARGGLWGNHGYEASYSMVWVDADGDALDGANDRYELRLSPRRRSMRSGRSPCTTPATSTWSPPDRPLLHRSPHSGPRNQ